LPFLLFLISFWRFISKVLFTADYNILHVALNLFFIFTYFLICAIYGQIHYPRKEFQKKNATNTLIKSVSFYLTIFVFLLYALLFFDWVENNYGIQPLHYLIDAFKRTLDLATSWWSVPMLIAGNIFIYKKTLRLWINEKLSYRPNVWNPKKEYSQILSSVCLLAVAFYATDFSTPDIYYGKVNTLVYKKNYKELEKALTEDGPSKWSNIYGMNPMLVAVNEGNLEMIKFLESKGLSFNGRITSKKNKYYGFDAFMFAVNSGKGNVVEYLLSKNFKNNVYNELSGFYPIHYAASTCKPQMIDVLVKNGADINVLNDKGETPLIVATQVMCFSSIVTLNEAGARFDLADKSGKTALDHLKGRKEKGSDDLRYFLEKHSRLPASETK
ncbi:MAG: ankyrin repeat domain-containing protein, partial [Bacteriovorax sp.]